MLWIYPKEQEYFPMVGISYPDVREFLSELGTGCYESFTGFVVLKLLEVVDEHFGKLGSLICPDSGIGVGVAGIENLGIYAGELGGNSEVEDRITLVGAFRIAPSRIASMMPRVSRMEIRLPEPFQPVLTR